MSVKNIKRFLKIARRHETGIDITGKNFVILNCILALFVISSTSGYTNSMLLLKAAGASGVIFVYFWVRRKNTEFFDKIHYFPVNKSLCLNLLVLLVYPLICIFYSANPAFGAQKWLTLLCGSVFLILFLRYFLLSNNNNYHGFLIIFLMEAALFTLSAIGVSPFSYSQNYSFTQLQFSHVIAGRFLGVAFLISLFLLMKTESKKRAIILGILLLLFSYGIIFTALRSAVLGLMLLSFLYVIYLLKKKELKGFNILMLVMVALCAAAIWFIKPAGKPEVRYGSLSNKESFYKDDALQSRLAAWRNSIRMIEEKPIFGWGFGGFRTGTDLNMGMKYPHNIFLEIQVELGIPGTVIFIFILVGIFRQARLAGIEAVIFFLFTLWLALFSKDIATNSLLWVNLLFYDYPIKNKPPVSHS